MVWNDELVCPGCGGTVCDRMADWMMQDGQSRTFHCDECGTALTVTAHVKVDYTVRREAGK